MKCRCVPPAAPIKSPFHLHSQHPAHQPYNTLSSNATQRPTSGAIHKHKLLFKRVTLYCIYITTVVYGNAAANAYKECTVRTLSRFHITQ